MKNNTPQYIRVKVKPNARKERILQVGDVYEISVREKAAQGAANKRVRELLAQTCNIPPKALRLVKGATSPGKLFLVVNHDEDENNH